VSNRDSSGQGDRAYSHKGQIGTTINAVLRLDFTAELAAISAQFTARSGRNKIKSSRVSG